MKKAVWNTIAVLLLLSFAIPDKESEKFMQDLGKCVEQVKKNKDTDLEIDYRVYHSAASKEAAEKAKGRFCRKGEKTYYNLLGTTFIQDREMLVMIDDSTRRVLVRKPGNGFNPLEQQMDPAYLKAYAKSITSKEKEGQKVYYQLEMKDAEIRSIGVTIDRNRKLIEQMDLYYAREVEIISPKGIKSKVLPKLEIAYVPVTGKIPEAFLDTRQIIQKDKKGFKLAARYKKYQLIDQYHNKTR